MPCSTPHPALFAIGTAQLASISLYQQWGTAGGRALRGGRGGVGRSRPGGPGGARCGPPRRRGRGNDARYGPWREPGRGHLALDDAPGRDLPRGPARGHAHAVVARGAVADRHRWGPPTSSPRSPSSSAPAWRTWPRQGPLSVHQAPPAQVSVPAGEPSLRRLQPVPPPHVAVRWAAQHRCASASDRRPGGVLGVHHPDRGDGHGAVSRPNRSPCAGAAEHDGVAHRGASPRHRGGRPARWRRCCCSAWCCCNDEDRCGREWPSGWRRR